MILIDRTSTKTVSRRWFYNINEQFHIEVGKKHVTKQYRTITKVRYAKRTQVLIHILAL